MKISRIFIFSVILISGILGFEFFTKSGFYLFLDMIFYPVYELKGFFDQTLFWHFMDFGSFLAGYEFFSKIFFVLVLSTGAFLGYKIGNFLVRFFEITDKNTIFFLQAVSITFSLSAPFMYERLVSQTGIALGVFCIGIGFVYLLEFFLSKSKGSAGIGVTQSNKELYFSSIFFGISFSIFPHSIVFAFLIVIFSLIFFFRCFSIKGIFIAFLIFSLINFNWIIGTFVLNSVEYGVKDTVASLNQQNIEVFKGNSLSGLGVELTHFFGYGFWGEKFGHLIGTDLVNKYFWVFGIMVYGLVGFGIYYFWKKDRKITYYLLILAFVSYVLALGISSSFTAPINQLLYDYVPYYIGMREPGKLLGLMSIIFIIFFGYGAYQFGLLLKKFYFDIRDISNFYLYLILIIVLLNGFNPNMLGGFKGQLTIIKYPQEYFQSKQFLEKSNYTKNIIFPWHSYIACKWKKGGVFSNTYSNILDLPETIKADNIEIEGLYTNYDNPVSEQVEKFLKERDVSILKKLGIESILFQDGCADAKKYKFLEQLDGLEKIFNEKYLKIYKIHYDKK